MVVVAADAELLQVVDGLDAGGGRPDLLDGRQEQADQDGDEGAPRHSRSGVTQMSEFATLRAAGGELANHH